MAVPSYDELMLPFLKVLSDGKERTNKEILENIVQILKLSQQDCEELMPNQSEPLLYYRLRWAKTYLKEAGLIAYVKRGIAVITTTGKKVLSKNPNKIDSKLLKTFDSFRDFVSSTPINKDQNISEDITMPNKPPEEAIYDAINIIDKTLANALADKIFEKDFKFFERLVVQLLCKMGYGGTEEDIVQSCGKSGDEGIDGVIKQDILGLDKIYIQAKRWTNNVSRPEIQKFVGAVHGQNATRGVFITTSTFSSEAKEYAQKINSNIILINGKMLTHLMIKYNVGVQVKDNIEIKKIDEDFFEEEI